MNHIMTIPLPLHKKTAYTLRIVQADFSLVNQR